MDCASLVEAIFSDSSKIAKPGADGPYFRDVCAATEVFPVNEANAVLTTRSMLTNELSFLRLIFVEEDATDDGGCICLLGSCDPKGARLIPNFLAAADGPSSN
jgi:hypothetical protein